MSPGAALLVHELAQLKGSKPTTELSRWIEILVTLPQFQEELQAFRELKARLEASPDPTTESGTNKKTSRSRKEQAG